MAKTTTPVKNDEEVEGLVNDMAVPEVLPQNSNFDVKTIVEIGYFEPPTALKEFREKRGLTAWPMLKVVWRPESYALDRNPENEFEQRRGGPFDCDIEWYQVYNNEGKLLGPNSIFGRFMEAVKTATGGVALTKNEVFRPQLRGLTFVTERVVDEYTRKNPDRDDGAWVTEDGEIDEEAKRRATRRTYYSFPTEKVEDYQAPGTRQTRKVGYGSGSITEPEVREEQIDALKAALHGKTEDEYADALFDSDQSELIMTEPFMSEAAEPARLTARMLKAGGKMLGGHIYFPEME